MQQAPGTPTDGDPPAGKRLNPALAWSVAIAMTLAAALGVAVLAGSRELWLDELQSVVIAQLPWGEKWRFVIGDNHPPLYFFLLSVLQPLLGDGPGSFRLLSVLAHALGGLGMFVVARRHLGDDRLSLFCCALFLASPALFYYGSEARMYALANLWMVLGLGLVLHLWQAPRGRTVAVALGVVSALAFYSHYVALFAVLGVLGYWVFAWARDTSRRQDLVWSVGTFAALTVPWIPILLAQRARKGALNAALSASQADPTTLSFASGLVPVGMGDRVVSLVENGASILGVLPIDPPALMAAINGPPALILATVLVVLFVRGEVSTRLTVAATVLTLVGTQYLDLRARRYFLMLAPFAILALGAALAHLTQGRRTLRRVGWTVGLWWVALSLAGAVRVSAAPQPKPIADLVAFLQEHYAPGDIVVFNALWGQVPFDYYAARAGFDPERRGFPVTVYDWWEQQPTKSWGSHVITRDDLAHYVREVTGSVEGRIWVAVYDNVFYDPQLLLLRGFEEAGFFVTACSLQEERDPASDPFRLFRVGAVPAPSCRS